MRSALSAASPLRFLSSRRKIVLCTAANALQPAAGCKKKPPLPRGGFFMLRALDSIVFILYHISRTEYLITSDGGMGPMKSRQPAFARCQIPQRRSFGKRLTDKESLRKGASRLAVCAGRFFNKMIDPPVLMESLPAGGFTRSDAFAEAPPDKVSGKTHSLWPCPKSIRKGAAPYLFRRGSRRPPTIFSGGCYA